jgi:hypothetical protein
MPSGIGLASAGGQLVGHEPSWPLYFLLFSGAAMPRILRGNPSKVIAVPALVLALKVNALLGLRFGMRVSGAGRALVESDLA